jgi:hypothetical protein
MEVIYREGYTDIEMEAGPYLSAVAELFRPTRHPVDEIVNLYGLPFDFGVDSTYATSLAILRRIMQREYDRFKKG